MKISALRNCLVILVCPFCLSWLTGCSGSGEPLPELAQVTGTVTLDGKPIENVSVIFQPETADVGSSRGTTDAEGKFSLMYNQDAGGAVPGKHAVRFNVMEADATGLLPDKYTRNNSGLSADVTQDGTNDFKFELKSK